MRIRSVLFAVYVLTASASAQRSPEIAEAIKVIESETKCYASPAPDAGEVRPICVWRPQKSGVTQLPVLYMLDGLGGLEIALIDLKPKIDAGAVAPMMIVATNAKPIPEERADEYLRGRSEVHFDKHMNWLLTTVLPWAEKSMAASPDRNRRFIGGFSNGADAALYIAVHHPDLFGGALLHSPTGASPGWVEGDRIGTQRWVVTGGTEELPGSIRRSESLQKDIARALQRRGAKVRLCIGRWGHEGRAWRQLSGGSLTWLLELGDVDLAGSVLEHGNCKNYP
jgi:enterochelin esterase-like enzyme